nr:zinc-binding dehydrogenase [Streptomyces sp. NRRL S-1813]
MAGLGGLGHLAVKLAVALGAETTVVSRSPDKAEDARRLGAHGFVVSFDPEQMAAARDRFDVVIDTISAPHDLGPYLGLVAMDGTLSHLGHLGPVTVETTELLVGRKKLSSAGSGGRPATAAMLDFCAEHGITADIELLPSARVNEALDRLRRNEVHYRFVLDMSDLDWRGRARRRGSVRATPRRRLLERLSQCGHLVPQVFLVGGRHPVEHLPAQRGGRGDRFRFGQTRDGGLQRGGLPGAAVAAGQVFFEGGLLRGRKGVQDICADGQARILGGSHQPLPRQARSFWSPVRIRVFTVPGGVDRASATSA